ncbi:hypothetical protein [Marinobacter alexandrii]|uniref:hypothetical protein n=1 Tax=Marinobacter alexandrii TaxID=2570351 RepID=UPI001107BDA0|nr:hypothetical protein [Marinobacter alexandrii]
MHSVPSRQKADDRRTRFEQYGKDHPYTCLPDTNPFQYLTQWLLDAGIAPGRAALTWTELDHYDHATGGVCSQWEMKTMMRMSREYTHWLGKGSRQSDIADDVPYIERTEETNQALQARLLESREKSAELAKEAKT